MLKNKRLDEYEQELVERVGKLERELNIVLRDLTVHNIEAEITFNRFAQVDVAVPFTRIHVALKAVIES